MSQNRIQLLVNTAVSKSNEHAERCSALITSTGLVEALKYCKSVRLTPPPCSLKANTPHAVRLRSDAARKLADPIWWARNLEQKVMWDFEHSQRMQGRVQNLMSDEMVDYLSLRSEAGAIGRFRL